MSHTLKEAELSILDDSICNKLTKKLGYHFKTELCAAKRNRIRVRNFIKKISHVNNTRLINYREIGNDYESTYGGVSSCAGDSGNRMFNISA